MDNEPEMSDAAADAIFAKSAEREVKGGGPANTDTPPPEPPAAPEPKATVELEEPPKVAPAAPPPPPVIPFPPPVAAPSAPEQRQAAPPAPAKKVATLADRIAKIQDLEIDDPLSGEAGAKVTVGELFKQNPGLFQLADALAGVHAEATSERFAEFEPMRASVEQQQQAAAFETDMKHLEAPVAQGGLGIADARKIVTHAGYADFLQKTPWAKAIAESGDESGFGIVLDAARKALKLEGAAATPPPAPRQQRKSDIALHESTIRGGGEEQRGGIDPDGDMDEDAQEKLFQAEAKKKEDERKRLPQ